MRPITGDASLGGPRHANIIDASSQMTYFLAEERSLDESRPIPAVRPPHAGKASLLGVESLETTMSSWADADEHDGVSREERGSRTRGLMHQASRSTLASSVASRSPSPATASDSRDPSPAPLRSRRASHAHSISQPATPLCAPSTASSVLDSSSRRNSLAGSYTDEIASQAIDPSDDEMEDTSGVADSGSVPQLVMPSIRMPSRRPFTAQGQKMGRFKVLMAGDSGVGKTSLIKAIVQICEDIVHVDPLAPTSVVLPDRKRAKSKSPRTETHATAQLTEVYASTKPYPAWWSESDDTKILRRRKSLGGTVLERNLCFVDTPGYGNGTSCMEGIAPVVQYVESQFEKSSTAAGLTESEMIHMLSGGGGPLVDVVFYVIRHRVKPVDIEYLRRLAPLTNIVPVIAQADTLSEEQLAFLKEHIMSELISADIKPFLFDTFPEDALRSSQPCAPYAVSTALSNDDDNMDASLLMSPDYVQPLVATELATMVEEIFNGDTIARLRHLAAKKYVQWRSQEQASRSIMAPQPVLSLQPYYVSARRGSAGLSASTMATSNSYALARITDHTQHEERLAQVRLSKWAADLQRSMNNERARFEALARDERAQWLAQRLEECIADGTMVAASPDLPRPRAVLEAADYRTTASGALMAHGTYTRRRSRHAGHSLDRADPLGLLQLNEELRSKSWAALQIVGSVGIIGGLAYWLARSWHREDELIVWGLDLSRFGFDL